MTIAWWTNEVDRLDVKVKQLKAALQEITDFERQRIGLLYTSLDAQRMVQIAKDALVED